MQLVIIILVVLAISLWLIKSKQQKVRSQVLCEEFIESHTDLENEEFCRLLGATNSIEKRVCLSIRNAVGELLGIPPKKLHPNQDVGELSLLHPLGIGVWLPKVRETLERDLMIKFDEGFYYVKWQEDGGPFPDKKTMTFGEFTGAYLKNMDLLFINSKN